MRNCCYRMVSLAFHTRLHLSYLFMGSKTSWKIVWGHGKLCNFGEGRNRMVTVQMSMAVLAGRLCAAVTLFLASPLCDYLCPLCDYLCLFVCVAWCFVMFLTIIMVQTLSRWITHCLCVEWDVKPYTLNHSLFAVWAGSQFVLAHCSQFTV